MDRIENEQIAELTEALVGAVRPTAKEIRDAMELAYRAGKIDGGVELANRLIADEAGAES